MKVLQLTSAFPAHIESDRYLYLWHSIEALHQTGIEPVVLYTPSWKPFISEFIDNTQFPIEIDTHRYFSIPRHYFRNISNASYLAYILPKIKKLHKLHRFNVIHAHGEISGLAAVIAAKQLGIPSVVTIHGIDMCSRMWKGRALTEFKNMFNQVDKLIFVGKSLKQHFEPMLNNQARACVVYNGVRLPRSTQHVDRLNQSPVRIISVSNLHEGKGVDITLQALANLKSQGFLNWFYTIVGSGDQRSVLAEIIKKYDLQNHVEFKSDLSHVAVYQQLQKANIFCLPSYREAFGIAYLEAMAHGLLTIGVKGQGPQAFIEHDKTGLLVEPRSVDDLTNTLLYALQNKEKMQYIAAAGKKLVLENFTWKQHAEKLIAVYDDLCGNSAIKN